VATIGALLFTAALVHRGPMLALPADDMLAMLLFYLALAPAGASLSLDAWIRLRRDPPRLTRPSSMANLVPRFIQVHLVAIYAASVVAQLRGDPWWVGTAVWGLIARPESRLIDVSGLSQWIYVLNFWTHAIVFFELAFIALIWNRTARPLILGISVVVWLSVALISGMVIWTLLLLIASLAFIPGNSMRDAFRRRLGAWITVDLPPDVAPAA